MYMGRIAQRLINPFGVQFYIRIHSFVIVRNKFFMCRLLETNFRSYVWSYPFMIVYKASSNHISPFL